MSNTSISNGTGSASGFAQSILGGLEPPSSPGTGNFTVHGDSPFPSTSPALEQLVTAFSQRLRRTAISTGTVSIGHCHGLILDFDQCTARTERAHFDRFLSAVNSFMPKELSPSDFRAHFHGAFHKPEDETCRIISSVLTGELGIAACPTTGSEIHGPLIKQRAIDHLGLVLPPLIARQIVKADPAIASLLEVADRDGKHLGIATASGAAVVETFLSHLGLPGQFKVKVYADASCVAGADGGKEMLAPPMLTKPFPEHYLCAARLLSQKPSDLVAFEDSGSGGCAALMAGIPLVLRPTNNIGKQLGKLEDTVARVLRSQSIPLETRALWGEHLLMTPLHVVRSFDQVALQ